MKNLTSKELSELLVRLGACIEARTWAEGISLAEAWATCPRGDWMLQLLARYGDIPRKTLVAIACDCAEPALVFLPPQEERPAECVATVRRWLRNEATLEEVRSVAARTAGAARAAARAARAAARAAEARSKSILFSANVCRKHISVE